MPERVVRVRAPTGGERVVAEAAKSLSPEKSLERVEATAKLVFANVAAVASILAGLGFLTDVGAALERGPQALGAPLPIVLVAVSLILATLALTPAIAKVRRSSLDEVQRYYDRQILRRGVCAILAMLTLATAIVVAVDVAANEADPTRSLAVSGELTGGGKDVTVKATANIGELRGGDELRLRTTAVRADGERLALCRATAGPAGTGLATASCTAAKAPRKAAGRIVLTAVVDRADEEPERRRLVLSR